MHIVAAPDQMVKAAPARRAVKVLLALAVTLVACWVAAALILGSLVAGIVSAPTAALAPSSNGCAATASGTSKVSLDDLGPGIDGKTHTDQLANAKTIVAVAKQLGVPAGGQVVGVATAMQESGLVNLPGGDGTSAGLFQLIDVHGSHAQRIDPAFSSRWFFKGLKTIPSWERLPLTVAAQAVQRSGFPGAYARWETLARQVVGDPAIAAAACTGTGGFPVPDRATVTADQAGLVAFGRRLQALGFNVAEHPAFPPVTPGAHAPNGWHYRPGGGAIDVNFDGQGQAAETAKLATIIPLARAAGLRIITQYPNHWGHMHLDISGGPDMGNFAFLFLLFPITHKRKGKTMYAALVTATEEFGTKGIQDFLLKSVIPLIMIYLVVKMYLAAGSGNYKKLAAFVGCFLIASGMLGLVIAPDAISNLTDSVLSKLQQG